MLILSYMDYIFWYQLIPNSESDNIYPLQYIFIHNFQPKNIGIIIQHTQINNLSQIIYNQRIGAMRINSTRPNLDPSHQQQQPQQPQEQEQNNGSQKLTLGTKKPKKQRKQFSLKPEHLQTGKGLQKLYQLTNQINWSDPMTTQSAMNLVVMTLKSWQYQLMPKYSYGYFLQRCQALGGGKETVAYMHKVRRIHKGEEQWEEGKRENQDPNKEKNEDKNKKKRQNANRDASDGQGLELGNPGGGDNYQNYDDDEQEMQKFRQRAQLAKKLASTNLGPSQKPNPSNKTQAQQQIDQMMQQDLRLFEQMSRKMESKIKNNNNKNNNNNNKNNNEKVEVQQEEEDGMELGGGESGVGFEDDGYYDD